MSYLIDNVAVNDRIDWRHDYIPGPAQGTREEQFPGVATRFAFSGPVLPPDLIVEGFLEGEDATLDGAKAEVETQMLVENLRRSAGVCDVTLNDVAYGSFKLIDFRAIDRVQGVAVAIGAKVRVKCRWHWRGLA